MKPPEGHEFCAFCEPHFLAPYPHTARSSFAYGASIHEGDRKLAYVMQVGDGWVAEMKLRERDHQGVIWHSATPCPTCPDGVLLRIRYGDFRIEGVT